MPYDRDSFLAGLAVGRTLWRPHRDYGEVPKPYKYLFYAYTLPLAFPNKTQGRDPLEISSTAQDALLVPFQNMAGSYSLQVITRVSGSQARFKTGNITSIYNIATETQSGYYRLNVVYDHNLSRYDISFPYSNQPPTYPVDLDEYLDGIIHGKIVVVE